MSWYGQLVYALALAFWKAYFDAEKENQRAIEEIPSAVDRARASAFSNAVLSERQSGDYQPHDTAPDRGKS